MYAPLLTYEEGYCLNRLIAKALIDPDLRNRVLTSDMTLIAEFDLSIATWQLISSIQAISLQDFCEQLVELETT